MTGFAAGTGAAGPRLVQGWCPGILRPMLSGDGYLVRVRPRAATVLVDDARALARLARMHGNGLIDLTGRANLQIRGVREEQLAPLADALLARGLGDATPEAETVRNILVSPLHGIDPGCAPVTAIARDLETRLANDAGLQALPAKFSFVLDGGGAFGLAGQRGDVVATAQGGGTRWRLTVDGERARGAVLRVDAVAAAMAGLARAFLALGDGGAPVRRERMAAVVRRCGAEALFGAAGLACEEVGARDPRPANPMAPRIGIFECGLQTVCLAAGAPFGALTSDVLCGFCDAATAAGVPSLRLTPWRSLVAVCRTHADAETLLGAARRLGLIVAPGDARLAIAACPGKPACAHAAAAARADASMIAGMLAPALAGALASRFEAGSCEVQIHVSGCAKGCAHPGRAAVTLTGNAQSGGYDLVAAGCAGQAPDAHGLSLAAALARIGAELRADPGFQEARP